MKYIIISQHDLEMAIVFDEIIPHVFVAAGRPVVSAGMCNQDGQAYGQSVTLALKSRPEDTGIIQRSMARHL